VEQMRFEDKLFIEFETPYTAFRLPPLTIQPIVENAVKHGIDPDLDPLYITVHTKKLKDGTEIIVEDTGPGFGVIDSDHPHTALANIQERLEMMCKGTLTFSDRDGGGTVVRLYIPDKNNESGNGKDLPQ
jgi:sensor histidine kinase YesM